MAGATMFPVINSSSRAGLGGISLGFRGVDLPATLVVDSAGSTLRIIRPQNRRHASDPQSAFDLLIERGHALSQRDQLSGF